MENELFSSFFDDINLDEQGPRARLLIEAARSAWSEYSASAQNRAYDLLCEALATRETTPDFFQVMLIVGIWVYGAPDKARQELQAYRAKRAA